MGANKVIDYTREDFMRSGPFYDIIFDAVGKSSYAQCKNMLTPDGIYLTTVIRWSRSRMPRYMSKKATRSATSSSLPLLHKQAGTGGVSAPCPDVFPMYDLLIGD